MIISIIVILLFLWVGNSIWWVIRHAGNDKAPKETWWNGFQALPVFIILWIAEQARKAKKHGVK